MILWANNDEDSHCWRTQAVLLFFSVSCVLTALLFQRSADCSPRCLSWSVRLGVEVRAWEEAGAWTAWQTTASGRLGERLCWTASTRTLSSCRGRRCSPHVPAHDFILLYSYVHTGLIRRENAQEQRKHIGWRMTDKIFSPFHLY